MRDDPLSDRNLKFRRAQRHVREVRRVIKAYGNRGPNETVRDPNLEGNPIVGFRVRRQPPASVSIAAGDALQDFKSALDHGVHELSRLNEATQEELGDCEFLIASKGDWYGGHKIKRLGKLPAKALDFVTDLQPFQGSLDTRRDRWALRVLHELARIDRHRHVHVTSLIPDAWEATISPVDGVIDNENTFAILVSDPSKVKMHMSIRSSVSIDEPSLMETLPLSNTMEQIEATVRGILLRLADFRP